MHADEALGIGRRLREPRDRDRRSVRCQHRLMPQHLADGLEDRSLDLLALGRRFDHEPTGRHADDAVDRLDPFERGVACLGVDLFLRSEEHTSELQSLMRISYAVFCLKKKRMNINTTTET